NANGTGETNNFTTSENVTSTLAQYPDLQVSSVALSPSSGLQSGNALTVNWTDANTGNKATAAGWYDRVVVLNRSTGKTVLDTAISYNPSVNGNGPIAVGDHRDRSTTFTLPDGPAGVGDLQATVTADSSNA